MFSENLINALKPYFGPNQIERGEDLYRRGRVDIVDYDDVWVAAVVTGTQKYDVDIEFRKKSFIVDCECPHFDQYGTCKHIWALFLAHAGKGGFALIDTQRPRVEPKIKGRESEDEEFNDFDQTNFDEEEFEEKEVGKQTHVTTPKSIPLNPSPYQTHYKKPAWSELLESMTIQPAVHGGSARVLTGDIIYSIVLSNTSSGTITVEIGLAVKDENGLWKTPKPVSIKPEEFMLLRDERDRSLLLSLFGTQAFSQDYHYYGYYQNAAATVRVAVPTMKVIVPRMLDSGRFFLKTFEGEYVGPLRADPAGAWKLRLMLKGPLSGGKYALDANLRRGEEVCDLATAYLFVADAFAFWRNLTVSPLEDHGCFSFISRLKNGGPVTINPKDLHDFLDQYFKLPSAPPIDLPPDLQPRLVNVAPKPLIRITSTGNFGPRNKLYCLPFFLYGNMETAALPFGRHGYDKNNNELMVRNEAAETAYLSRLPAWGINTFQSTNYYYGDPPDINRHIMQKKNLPDIVTRLLDEGWRVEAEGALYRKAGNFSASVTSSGTDWFDLHIEYDFEGASAGLPALLSALKKGERFVRLGDGAVGMLPEEWLKKFAPFARMGSDQGDAVRFHRSQALILDLLLSEQPHADFDETFRRVRDELRDFSGVSPREASDKFRGILRSYQKDGLGWLHFLGRFGFGGCLADDMGLGKTIQVLALLAGHYGAVSANDTDARKSRKGKVNISVKRKPSLIVAPRSLIFNWMQEAARFTPELRVLDHSHLLRVNEEGLFDDYDIVLITYGTLRRDIEELLPMEFEYVILDEAQTIKNAGTITAKAARLLKAAHRLALSGTPVENHLGELWSIFEFLNPGMLGSASVFAAAQKSLFMQNESTMESLRRALRPFILRRTKAQVATDLPPRQEETLMCEMESKQRKLYDELRDHYRVTLLKRVKKDGINKSKIHVLEALLRLRQAACHPGLIDRARAAETSAKLETLLAQIDEVLGEGHKAIVFSQFTSMLAILRSRLDARRIPYEYLDGGTTDRRERVEHFQNDAGCPLFLISLKAGGMGLNLTAAEYVFLLDPWWNPAVEAQAIDRAHRIGQTRPVFAYRLICKGTVEEKILEMQKTKRQLADSIINADNSVLRSLNAEDLSLLLS